VCAFVCVCVCVCVCVRVCACVYGGGVCEYVCWSARERGNITKKAASG